MQRLAVLTTALSRSPPDPELVYEAMKDRIHQPYRRNLVGARPVRSNSPLTSSLQFSIDQSSQIPGLPEVTSIITPHTHPGLLGICLSGAGPTILALALGGFETIAEDARKIFRENGVEVDWMVLDIVTEGSSVEDT